MSVSRLSQTSLQNAFQKYNTVWDGKSAVGAMEAISSVTLSAAQGSVEFNNIPQTYTHLQIRGINRGTRAVNSAFAIGINVQFNGDTTSNYNGHELRGDGTSATSGVNGQSSGSNIIDIGPGSTTTANVFGAYVCDILDYTSTNKTKVMRSLGGADLNGSGGVVLNSGIWLTYNAAITSILLASVPSGNFDTYSSFTLYGIK